MNDPTAPESAVEKIDSGVWSIRVPMPRHPLRASLCYAYVAEDGTATVIDPGWPTEESWTALVDGLRAIGADPARVDQILLTHGHRDHSGLAGRLAKVSGARVRLHREDREMLVPKGAAHGERVRHWLALAGVDDTDSLAAASLLPALPPFPDQVSAPGFVHDGDVVSVPGGELVVHWTPGHTPGHVCFEDAGRGLLFTGDHVLPRISPNVSTMVGHRASALTDYLESLGKVARLAVSRVLPGHERHFTDIAARVDALFVHHRRRLDEILVVLADRSPHTTLELARELTWSRRWDEIKGLQQRAALGEVLSHLHFLHDVGAVDMDAENIPLTWRMIRPDALAEAWGAAGYPSAA